MNVWKWLLAAVAAAGIMACASQAKPAAPGNGESAPPPAVKPETTQTQSFVVSKEVYNQTFGEIEAFINLMNKIIQKRDFESWKQHLSDSYIKHISDPEFLRQQSETPTLKKGGIVLQDMKDYFDQVVVPSRSQTKLDDIEFVDSKQVKAISMVRNTRGVLYLMVRDNGGWKIGVW